MRFPFYVWFVSSKLPFSTKFKKMDNILAIGPCPRFVAWKMGEVTAFHVTSPLSGSHSGLVSTIQQKNLNHSMTQWHIPRSLYVNIVSISTAAVPNKIIYASMQGTNQWKCIGAAQLWMDLLENCNYWVNEMIHAAQVVSWPTYRQYFHWYWSQFSPISGFMTPATCAAEIGLLLEHAAAEISRYRR